MGGITQQHAYNAFRTALQQQYDNCESDEERNQLLHETVDWLLGRSAIPESDLYTKAASLATNPDEIDIPEH